MPRMKSTVEASSVDISMDLHAFQVIAIALKDPLVLVGFGLLLIFEVCRRLLQQVPQNGRACLFPQIVQYGFLMALLLMLLGFGLQWERDRHTTDHFPENRIEGGIHGERNHAEQSVRTDAQATGFHQPVGQKDRNASENHFSGGIHGNGNTVKQSINIHEEPE